MTAPQITLSQAEREKLIEDHVGYVRTLATRVRRDIGTDLDLDELVSYGMTGLVEAGNRFDPTRRVAFTTFSYYRIRGAIFDGLRQLGWLNRGQYARFQAATNDLMQNLSDRPDPPSAPHSEADPQKAAADLASAVDQIATIFITSLDDVRTPEQADPLAANAAEAAERRSVHRTVRQAVEQLPPRERELLQLYYFKDLTLEAAGKKLGLSKSWTSRLHARAIENLTKLVTPALDC